MIRLICFIVMMLACLLALPLILAICAVQWVMEHVNGPVQ